MQAKVEYLKWLLDPRTSALGLPAPGEEGGADGGPGAGHGDGNMSQGGQGIVACTHRAVLCKRDATTVSLKTPACLLMLNPV